MPPLHRLAPTQCQQKTKPCEVEVKFDEHSPDVLEALEKSLSDKIGDGAEDADDSPSKKRRTIDDLD